MTAGIDASYWGQRAYDLLECVAKCSEIASGHLGEVGVTRLPYTPQHAAANDLLSKWMISAGMAVSLDPAATLIGRLEGQRAGKTLLIGSHQDSVREGGGFDGIMGVVLPILAVQALTEAGWRPRMPVEILAFADEEGVRFPTALTGPRALAGTLDPSVLDVTDRDGMRLGAALTAFGGDETQITKIARPRSQVSGYLEIHIEQGPVLQDLGHPLGIVTGICGIERHEVLVTGVAAHAGTMPMQLRRDALAGAAQIIAQVEEMARQNLDLLGVVGDLRVYPNAVNAVPGRVELAVELRSVDDSLREGAGLRLQQFCRDLAQERTLQIEIRRSYSQAATPCSMRLQKALQEACGAVPTLPSGATHDASAMAELCDVGMLFLRCRDGISHNPKEHATAADMGQAIASVSQFLAQNA